MTTSTHSDKPHLSPSQLNTFTRCGEQWRRRYQDREVIPPGVVALTGSGVHRGAEMNMRQKLESRQDLPAGQIVDAAVAGFDERLRAEGVELSAEEQSRGQPVVIDEARDATAAMARFHAAQQAPDYQPALVEEMARIELPLCSHDLVGRIDLADEAGRIIDFKTGSRRKPKGEADGSIQLSAYAELYRARVGQFPAELRLDGIVQQKRGIVRDLHSTVRDATDIAVLRARIQAVSRAILHGTFVPAPAGSWWCSTRFCGYARTCPYFNADREAAAESE